MIQQWQSRGGNCTDFSQILTMCQCISSSTGCSIREKGSCPRETTTLSSIVGSFDPVALIEATIDWMAIAFNCHVEKQAVFWPDPQSFGIWYIRLSHDSLQKQS